MPIRIRNSSHFIWTQVGMRMKLVRCVHISESSTLFFQKNEAFSIKWQKKQTFLSYSRSFSQAMYKVPYWIRIRFEMNLIRHINAHYNYSTLYVELCFTVSPLYHNVRRTRPLTQRQWRGLNELFRINRSN